MTANFAYLQLLKITTKKSIGLWIFSQKKIIICSVMLVLLTLIVVNFGQVFMANKELLKKIVKNLFSTPIFYLNLNDRKLHIITVLKKYLLEIAIECSQCPSLSALSSEILS